MKRAERNRLLKTYGPLYARHFVEDAGDCFYCGAARECLDHCPPISAFEYTDADYLRKEELPLALVPCCLECNGMLGDRRLFTVQERLEFLELRYEREYSRAANLWSDDEIAEMGPSFQRSLRARKSRQYELARRVRSVQSRLARPWTHPVFTPPDLTDD